MRLIPALIVFVVGAPTLAAADFDADVRPLLESKCLACHSEANKLGDLSLETSASALQGGAAGPSIVPGAPDRSPLLARMELPGGTPGAMPPAGPRPSERELSAVREWILDGARWTSSLNRESPAPASPADEGELELVRQIRSRIVARSTEGEGSAFEAYDQAIPESDAKLQMVPIPAGEFSMGTPPSEAGRDSDEGPARTVRVEAFWMGAHEVSWDAFRHFMLRVADVYVDPDEVAAAVSSPTPPYVEMSFGMGISGYPAISMTQHAASKYAQWLSAKTGRFYRLPTEAEWEYACRSGSRTAYGFGDDPAALEDYGWFADNSGGQYRPLGTKRPNAWGLYDMHGNVWEWTLDRYQDPYPDSGTPAVAPWERADKLYPRVARGGSWMDGAGRLRCGARRASSEAWKVQDPQLPKSIWYHTDAPWLGFRLVRPAKLPSAEMMYAYWNSATGKR